VERLGDVLLSAPFDEEVRAVRLDCALRVDEVFA
jgi:hypothetical protein